MRSAQFDDIYFSAEDGLAETRHTFLQGNGLPEAWRHVRRFCICETGFGTGLNMLAAWRLFEETARPEQRLDLISIEKYPLTRDEIRTALAPWTLQPQLDRLLAQYPIRVRSFHRLNLTPRVTLTLIFDDVLAALPQLDAQVDAWFLDGFAPAKNLFAFERFGGFRRELQHLDLGVMRKPAQVLLGRGGKQPRAVLAHRDEPNLQATFSLGASAHKPSKS